MRKYETIVVFSPEASEEKLQADCKRFEAVLKTAGVEKVVVDRWGKREISYLVGRHKFGTYVCFAYETAAHAASTELANILRITDSVIKFQSHRIADKVRKFKGNPKRRTSIDSDDYSDGSELAY
jgi:small subunit ribosomal protein S6